MSSVDSIPFLNSVLVLILLDHWGCHVNSFPIGVLLFKWIPSFSPSARSILSFLNGIHSICQVVFVFPALPPFFLQGPRSLNHVSFLLMGSLSILFRQCSYPVILRKILTELQVYHSSFSFLLRWIQLKLSVLIVFLPSFQMLSHAGAPLNHPLLAIHLFWSTEDISGVSCYHP